MVSSSSSLKSSETTPRIRTAARTPKSGNSNKKPSYEFSAPQYYDFAGPSPGVPPSDSWFEKDHSPIARKGDKGGTPRNGESPNIPATVTKERRRISKENHDDMNDCKEVRDSLEKRRLSQTPKQVLSSSDLGQPSPMTVNNKRSSGNIFIQSDKPTSSTTDLDDGNIDINTLPQHQHEPYDQLFQIEPKHTTHLQHSNHKTSPGQPQLGKVRTPDRVKLARLKMAAPLLPTRSTKPLTVPVEFNFSNRTRSYKEEETTKSTFQVPNKPKPASKPMIPTKKLTVPESPMLMTKLRTKPQSSQTQSESKPEEKPLRPVTENKKPKITVPVDISLMTALRGGKLKEQCGGLRSTSPFVTTEIPLESLSINRERPKSLAPHITVPISPKLSTSRRAKSHKNQEDIAVAPPPFKARPVPHPKPFQPKLEHHSIKPLPVVLPGDAITEEKRKRFSEALERERAAAEEARKFQGVPPPKTRPLTKPEPFQLESDLRYQVHHAELARRIKEEEERSAQEREFHCRPVPQVVPFLPKKSVKPLTQVSDISLHSTERAAKRKEFDDKLRRKEEELEELEREQQEIRRKREEEEIRQLRKHLVPKAQPVMHYPNVDLKPSNRPLTIPQSPPLLTLTRTRKRT